MDRSPNYRSRTGKKTKRSRKKVLVILSVFLGGIGCLAWFFVFSQTHFWWRTLTRESSRILGLEKEGVPSEEKRIREEVIVKKMEETSAGQDWRALAPEYPRPKKSDTVESKERMKAFKDSPEYKEMERVLLEHLQNRKDLSHPELPTPSLKEAGDFLQRKDKGEEKVMERLLGSKEKTSPEKPLEENLLLGIKGPLSFRKIVERPHPPQARVKVEAEIELTLYVLPSGIVDRVIPSLQGDAELERAAIQYVKRWRFAPLPKDQPQAEQWGTLPIRFRLQ
jgi:TonB family protein